MPASLTAQIWRIDAPCGGVAGGARSVNFEVASMNVSLEYNDMGSDGMRGGRVLSKPLRPEHTNIINRPEFGVLMRLAEEWLAALAR